MSAELAYMAGYFDGEGSLGHWKSGRGRTFQLCLVNSNRAIIEEFVRHFGGNIHDRPAKPGTIQRKMLYAWRVYGEDAWNAYYALRPWLREKIWKQEPK